MVAVSLIGLACALPRIQAAEGLVVFDDVLGVGWDDWSYGSVTVDYGGTDPVYAGMAAIAVTYEGGWSGLQVGYHGAYLDVGAYDTFRFWVHGGSGGGQLVLLTITLDGSEIKQAFTPAANTWTRVDVSLLGHSPREVYSVQWFNNSPSDQATYYLDEISFVDTGAPTPTPTSPPAPGEGPPLSVDAAAGRHPINPHIYGMNFTDEDVAEAVRLPVRRWGGNSTSRYNWEIDVHNTGSDWYYENIPNSPGAVDGFVEQDQGTSTETILTMPLIGWTPKRRLANHPYDCGFKVSMYGPQDSVDPWDTDCGNGDLDGVPIVGNNPLDTSMVITESFVVAWIDHLSATHGSAASGGVRFYNLDNEPMLWNSTHRDVHPSPVTYDEIRDRTYLYAAAVKAADPAAQTLGPVTWGWCAYLYSASDGCSPGPDRLAHGDVDFTVWYLAQMQAYEATHGVRLLDYLDLHYYPQASGVALSPAGDAATRALRLRSTRSLWDPTYQDESWISDTTADPIQFIPRMRQWVSDNYTGTKLAITEYNWGALDHINGALAQADVLGIFGREGLDLATLWGPPGLDDPGTFAFRMYRNYDGLGSGFGETSVQAASGDQGQLAIYAAERDTDGALTLMIINKTDQALTSDVSLANFGPGATAQVYRYSEADLGAIVRAPDQPVTASGFTAQFPADSITLVVVPPGGGPLTGVEITGPVTGTIGAALLFTAVVSPSDASTPITYTWSPGPDGGQGTPAATYRWGTGGVKVIAIAAENSGGPVTDEHEIAIWEHAIWLPLAMR